MAVARLSRVTLGATRGELGILLARVIKFGTFDPSRRDGMVQDVGILLLASRAQAVSSQASELLATEGVKDDAGSKQVERFEAHTVDDLVSSLEEYVEVIDRNLSLFTEEDDRRGVIDVLQAVKEASSMVFTDLQRIFVYPPKDELVRFEGFVPSGSLKSFEAQLGGYVLSAEPVKANEKDSAYVPTLLVNPRAISVFEDLTLQRGLPHYGEVDPTPIIAFVFPFFFGMMFGDIGHGILLLALGAYLIKKTSYRSWGEQILVLSSSTTVFGLIRGSFFGTAFVSPLSRIIALPPAFSASFTLSYIPFWLELAVVIGTFHMASGYAIAFVNQERAGNYVDAFLNRLPTALLYSFTVAFGLAVVGTTLNLSVLFTSNAPTPVFNDLLGLNIPVSVTAKASLPVVLVTLCLVVVSHPVKEYLSTRNLRSTAKAFGLGLADAVAKPFEFFMNTISYIRLGVLLITTSLLGSLAAGMATEGILGLFASILVGLAVIALEGVIVYVQDMRLQLYEWFSEFFEGNGTPFVGLISGGTHFSVSWA